MLLAIDVGNTNITLGLFEEAKLKNDWRLSTNQQNTRDELGLRILSLLQTTTHQVDPQAVVISSVVPYLNQGLKEGLEKYLGLTPSFLKPDGNGLIQIETDEPHAVGPDRIANSIAAQAKFETPALVIDFGTATSFDLISGQGSFIGGAIAPEMEIAMEALYERAALLPEIELELPDSVIGKTTAQSLNSGFVFGFISLISGMIDRFKREYSQELNVIATGGKGRIFYERIEQIPQYEEYLVLEGLRIWWEKRHRSKEQDQI